MKVKFMYNGIKVDGKLYKAWYSLGGYQNYHEGTITIYARDYGFFPRIDGLNVGNDADFKSYYFLKDCIRVTPDNWWYPQVLEAYNKQQVKRGQKTYTPLFIDKNQNLISFGVDNLVPFVEERDRDSFQTFSKGEIPQIVVMNHERRDVQKHLLLRGTYGFYRFYSLVGKVRREEGFVNEFPVYRLERTFDGKMKVGIGWDQNRDEHFISVSGWYGPYGTPGTLDEAWEYAHEYDFVIFA